MVVLGDGVNHASFLFFVFFGHVVYPITHALPKHVKCFRGATLLGFIKIRANESYYFIKS